MNMKIVHGVRQSSHIPFFDRLVSRAGVELALHVDVGAHVDAAVAGVDREPRQRQLAARRRRLVLHAEVGAHRHGRGGARVGTC